MAPRNAQRTDRGLSRKQVEKAIRTLKKAVEKRPDDIRDRLKIARAYRVIGELELASTWYRDVADRLATRGDALKALAVTRELMDFAAGDSRALLMMAKLYARSARTRGDEAGVVARPLAAPPPADEKTEPVLDASELVRVQTAEGPASTQQAAGRAPAMMPWGDDDDEKTPVALVRRKSDPPEKAPRPAPPGTGTTGEFEIDVDTAMIVSATPAAPRSQPRRGAPGDVFRELIREATGVHKLPPKSPGRADTPTASSTVPARTDDWNDSADYWDEPSRKGPPPVPPPLPPGAKPVSELQAALALARVPLFSQLGQAAFVELTRGVILRPVPAGTNLFQEGEKAVSFFLVAEGALEVVRRARGKEKVLAHLQEWQAVGVFGLFAGQRRAASVRAIGDATVLEIPGRVLSQLVQKHPKARQALRDFYTERLLENFFATAPIFESLDAVARASLIGRFRHRDLHLGERLIEPGTMTNGLYLLVRGDVEVARPAGAGKTEVVAKLARGQFFGIVAALAGRPTGLTARARTEVTIAELDHRAFSDFLAERPELKELPKRLEELGMLKQRELFVGDGGVPGLAGGV